MFTPAKDRHAPVTKQSKVKDCYLIEYLDYSVRKGDMFSTKLLQELELNRAAFYFEAFDEAKKYFREKNDPEFFIIQLKDVPLEYYEQKVDGSFDLKRDNVTLMVTGHRFIKGVYFVPENDVESDFIYQARSSQPNKSPRPNNPINKCTIL